MKVVRNKYCYCHECRRDFHYMGIGSHKKSHLHIGEPCKITYSNGDTYIHFPDKKEVVTSDEKEKEI